MSREVPADAFRMYPVVRLGLRDRGRTGGPASVDLRGQLKLGGGDHDVDVIARPTDAREEETGIVVFTRVDDPTTGRGSELCGQMPLHAAAVLCSWGVRLVCVSTSTAAYVQQVQRELDIIEPFICEGGAALHVPSICWRTVDASNMRAECSWDVFRFNPPDRAAAVTLVRDLFVAHGLDDPLTIGIGCDCDDYGVLTVVDIPIVVRDAVKDQSMLLRHVPGAYLTMASGPEGWSEALIGS